MKNRLFWLYDKEMTNEIETIDATAEKLPKTEEWFYATFNAPIAESSA
jgi:hypothetical protein